MKRTKHIEKIIVTTVARNRDHRRDDIDHVYTNGQIPPPGSFAEDAAAVIPVAPAAPAAPKRSRFFDSRSGASGIFS